MKTNKLYTAIITIFLVIGCGSADSGKPLLITGFTSSGKKFTISVKTGQYWMNTFKIGIFSITSPPQIAVWTEDDKGVLIDTVYVTRKFATQNWNAASGQQDDATFRPEALPVWHNKYIKKGNKPVTKKNPLMDAVTGASPKSDFIIKSASAKSSGRIFLQMEVNVSFDVNNSYPSDVLPNHPGYNATSGQPAVIYKTEIDLSKNGEYKMEYAGYAHPSGKNGNIYPGKKGITSADKMIETASVIVE